MHARSHYKDDNIIIRGVLNQVEEDSGVAKTDRMSHVILLNFVKCEYLQSASLQGARKKKCRKKHNFSCRKKCDSSRLLATRKE